MQWAYARALYEDPAATLDDLREAVETVEETERIARRVLGGSHPLTVDIGRNLQIAQELLRHAREAGSEAGDVNSVSEALAALPPLGSA